ncbi:hypothetical protein [Actinoplanes sp. NPDC049118]|uniref:hypothetical protein n=1 Tax=Actinoplanes sp. NPDC049118 TaxID=3155769 RepID=UPI0033D6B0D6
MPFPAGLTLVSVHGRFDALPSGGASGRLRFECPYTLLGPTDNSIVAPFTRSANLDEDGEFSVQLPATNDPGWTPVDWAYAVRATIGGVTITGTLQLDYQTASVELADLLQVDGAAVAGTTYATLAQLNALGIDDIADLQTQLDGKQPAGTYLTPDDIDNLVSYETLTEELAAKLDADGGEVVDSTLTVRKGDNSSGLRFRSTGGAVDVDKMAGDVVISSFAGPVFGGAQTALIRLRSAGSTLAGLTEFGSTVYLAEQSINAATGVAYLGAKNSATNLGWCGYLAIAGAPTSGTWAVNDVVVTLTGIYRCTVAGTPGTWQNYSTDAGVIKASDHGFAGWTFEPTGVQAGTILPTAGLSYVVRFRALASLITNIHFHFTVAGSGLTAGQCFASLHTDAGVQLGITADQASNWATGGFRTCALTAAQAVTPGDWYKVRWWYNGTTAPTLSRGVNSSSAITNAGLSAPNFRFATADSGLTTAGSAPSTIGTMTGGATAWWVGVS